MKEITIHLSQHDMNGLWFAFGMTAAAFIFIGTSWITKR